MDGLVVLHKNSRCRHAVGGHRWVSNPTTGAECRPRDPCGSRAIKQPPCQSIGHVRHPR